MEKPYLKIELLKKNATVPTKRPEDGCFDLYGCFDEDPLLLFPGDIKLVSLGFRTEFPKDWIFRIFERSSAGSKGISMRCGVIDSGYRGEYFAAANNTSNKLIILSNKTKEEILKENLEALKEYKDNFIIYPQNKAIAQGGLIYTPHIEIEEVNELDMNSLRGEGSLGSTGK